MLRPVPLRNRLPSADIVRPAALTAAAAGALTYLAVHLLTVMPFDGDGMGRDRQSYIASLDPPERVQHDYSGHDDSGDDCLEPTGYDVWDPGHNNKLINIGRVSIQNGVITVTPGQPNEGEPVLRLRQNDGHEPLQAADESSRQILAINNCALGY